MGTVFFFFCIMNRLLVLDGFWVRGGRANGSGGFFFGFLAGFVALGTAGHGRLVRGLRRRSGVF